MGFLITTLVLVAFLFSINGFSINIDIQSQTPDIYFAGGFVALIIFFTLLTFIILFWNGFDVDYAVDSKGLYQSVKGTSSKIHNLAVIAGLLGRSSAAVGTGLTAKGGEDRHISWREIRTIQIRTQKRYIHVTRTFFGIYPIDMFYTNKHAHGILSYINKYARAKTIRYS